MIPSKVYEGEGAYGPPPASFDYSLECILINKLIDYSIADIT